MFAALPPAPPAAVVSHTAAEARTYVVRRGDTISGIAARHGVTWNALRRANGIGRGDVIRVGQRLTIPGATAAPASRSSKSRTTPPRAPRPTDVPTRTGASQAQVRAAIVAEARRHGVDPNLALAVGWQESRWRQDVRSHAGAIGAMQCMPSAGEWMASRAGRELDLRDLRDNATCGVLMLRTLQRVTGDERETLAAYYEGIGAVQRRGVSTAGARYAASVQRHRDALVAGRPLRD